MDFNFLGVAFVSDDLPKDVENMVYWKMEKMQYKIRGEFEQWLDENNLEQIMGVIVRKGTFK